MKGEKMNIRKLGQRIVATVMTAAVVFGCSACNVNDFLGGLFTDSSTWEDSTGGPFLVGSYPQEFEYRGRRYRYIVQDVGTQPEEVEREEVGELLGYLIREEDVEDFIAENLGVDYVISAGIYDYE